MFLHSVLVKEVNNTNYTPNKIHQIYKKIYKLEKKAINSNSISQDFYFWMKSSDFLLLKLNNWEKNTKKIFELQNNNQSFLSNNIQIFEPSFILKTIGSCYTLDAIIKSGILGHHKKNKFILPITNELKKSIINKHILNYYKKYVTIIENDFLAKQYLKRLNKECCWHHVTIPTANSFLPLSHPAAVLVQKEWIQKKNPPLFKLTSKDFDKGTMILNKMGISKDKWFVTVHVRDFFFKGKEKYRDCLIADFFETFNYVSEMGGYTIIVGDTKRKPLPAMNNVIDYSLSEFKSDFMDIFLCASAKFMIGTSSGLTAVSHIFNVPIAMTNYLPLASTYFGKNDLFMPKLLRSKHTKKLLSFNKITSAPFTLGVTDGMYENILEVEPISNTSDEILSLIKEMNDRIDKVFKYSKDDLLLQKKFSDLTIKNKTLYGTSNLPIQCPIGNNFIKKYSYLL